MKKTALASALLLSTAFAAQSEEVTSASAPVAVSGSATYRAFNTPVNYNFGEIMTGISTPDLPDGAPDMDTLVIRGGGEGMVNENWIYNLYYTGGIIDEVYFTSKSNTFSVGAMYRYPLADKLDLVAGGDLLIAWSEVDVGSSRTTASDVGFGLKSSLRYGFTQNLEGKVEVGYDKVGDNTAKNATGSVTFYPAPSFGIGATYGITRAEAENGFEIDSTIVGGYVRFNF